MVTETGPTPSIDPKNVNSGVIYFLDNLLLIFPKGKSLNRGREQGENFIKNWATCLKMSSFWVINSKTFRGMDGGI